MKVLSQKQAERCEMARERTCKCRCGGSAHGKGRLGEGADFSELPMDDPHYRPPLTRNQVLRLLNKVAYYVACLPGIFADDGLYQASREARDIVREAREKVLNER